MNHYKWYFWLYPYTKNTSIFFCPSRSLSDATPADQTDWNNNAQIDNGYALNYSLTGGMNVYKNGVYNLQQPGAIRNSFSGGTEGGVRSTSDTMLMMEKRGVLVPAYYAQQGGNGFEENIFPAAIKEHFNLLFFNPANTPSSTTTFDTTKPVAQTAAPHNGGINIAYCDGHAKWMKVQQFLDNTPSKANFLVNAAQPKYGDVTGANFNSGESAAGQDPRQHLDKDYPFWNLYKP